MLFDVAGQGVYSATGGGGEAGGWVLIGRTQRPNHRPKQNRTKVLMRTTLMKQVLRATQKLVRHNGGWMHNKALDSQQIS